MFSRLDPGDIGAVQEDPRTTLAATKKFNSDARPRARTHGAMVAVAPLDGFSSPVSSSFTQLIWVSCPFQRLHLSCFAGHPRNYKYMPNLNSVRHVWRELARWCSSAGSTPKTKNLSKTSGFLIPLVATSSKRSLLSIALSMRSGTVDSRLIFKHAKKAG